MKANSSAAPTSSSSGFLPEDTNSGDWRSELPTETRIQTLESPNSSIKSLSEHNELKDFAVDSEQMTYQHAKNKDDYIQKISANLHAVDSLNPSHPNLSAGDLTSTHSGFAGAVDWQEEIYQKIKSLKEPYLQELIEEHQKITSKFQQCQQQESLPPAKRTEPLEKLKNYISSLNCMIQILEASKNDVKADWREKIPDLERNIVTLLASSRSKIIAPAESQSQQKFQHSGGQARYPIPREPEKLTGTVLTTPANVGHLAQSQAQQKFQYPRGQATSSTPGEPEKLGTNLTTGANIGYQQAGVAPPLAQDISIALPRISASPLQAELTSPDGNQTNTSTSLPSKSITKEDPLELLIKLVETMPSNALKSAVRDIKSVVRMVHTVAGSAPGYTSRSSIGEDLAATTNCRLQGGNFISQVGSIPALKMKRNISTICRDDTSGTESPAKRQKEEAKHDLLKEILETNQQLFYTVIGIIDEEDSGATLTSNSEGTMVKFSFKTTCLSPNLRSHFFSGQMSPITPLRLLIPADYPECSPMIIHKAHVTASKEPESLSAKAWSTFDVSFRLLNQPVTLRELARTWEHSVRKVITEYVVQIGGGSFGSIYGGWESC